jgi:FADH2 O2-dependent halogenase
VHVTRIDLEPEQHPVVHFRLGAKMTSLSARMVVDASGRSTLLGKALRLKVNDPVFCQFALHTWFEGYARGDDDKADYIFIHFLPMSNSWLWQIPITESITSFGVVTQKKHYPKTRDEREAFFWNCVDTRPDVRQRLRAANQIRPFKEEGDYSYAMSQLCGDRFVLVGDAARFVDPIFSSGVSIALNGARLATADILPALDKGDLSRDSFANFETNMKRGTRNWYRFITMYYRLNVLFTTFIQHASYRTDVLKLLQGDLYDEDEPPVLTKMREIVSEVENDPTHLWHDFLGDLTDSTYRVYA